MFIQNVQDAVEVFGFTTQDVHYPRSGPFACCFGRHIGTVKFRHFIDASDEDRLSEDMILDILNEFKIPGINLSNIQLPTYIGAGIDAWFTRTREGEICCRNPTWVQTKNAHGEKPSGDGRYSQSNYVDFSGHPLMFYPGHRSADYHLELKCHAGGESFTVWELHWGYEADWQTVQPKVSIAFGMKQ